MSEQVPDPSEQQASQKAEGQSRTDARPEATEQKKAADAPAERPAPKPARKAPRKAAQAARGSAAEHAGKPQAKTRRPQRKPAGNQPPRAKAPTKATPRPSDTGAGRKAGAPKASDTGTSTPKGKVTMPPALSRLKKAAQGIKPPSLGTLRHPSTFAKVLMALVVVYVVGIVFFWSRFLPQTTVDGRDVSWRSVSSVTEELAQAATDYELKVWGERVAIQLNGDDIALAFDKKAFADAVAHPIQKFFWPLTSLFPRSDMAPGSVTFNDGTLRGITDAATEEANVEAAGSGNATVAYDAQSGRFVGVGESQGTAVDAGTLHAQVSRAVATLQDALKLDSSVLVKPTVTESDPRFPKALESAQDFPDLTIDLRLSNIVVETIEPDLVKSWLKVSDDYEIAANERAIEDWTRGDLSAKLDSVGALRTWERWDGKQIQVFDGTYGWNIDGAQLAQDIAARINDRSEVPIEVPCTQRAALYNPGGPDWGNRYIEVDLTEQYAYMYDEAGDLIWQSECVTGNESENDGTVTGVYFIEKKKSPETLIGLDNDGDGEPDYENEVEFWMPFYGGFGLHDALWRDSFDYDTYLTDGSHGCVNLPYYAAASLYELCEVGDPVVVHW